LPSRSRTTVGLAMTTPQVFIPICLIDYRQRNPVAEYSDHRNVFPHARRPADSSVQHV
jgi:hypothetical protein